MSKKNILHFYPYLNNSCGVTNSIKLIVKNSLNFNHCILTFGGNAVNDFERISHVINLEKEYKVSPWDFLYDISRIIKICRTKNINILHSHHRYFDLTSFIIHIFLRLETVTTVRSIVRGRKYFSYNSYKLIAVSNFVKEHLVNYFRKKEENIKVIHNFFDESEVKIDKTSHEIRTEFGISEKTIVFGSFGRIDFKEKSTDELIKIFNKFSNLSYNVVLLLIGDGKDYKYAKELIEDSSKIILQSGKKNIHNYYNLLNYYILASVNDPCPNVILEAGYHKIPIIANNCGGIPEILKKDGILFNKNDFIDLEIKILNVLNRKIVTEKIVSHFYERVVSDFGIKSKIKNLEDLYESS